MAEWTDERRQKTPLRDFGDPENKKYPISDLVDFKQAWAESKSIGNKEEKKLVQSRLSRIAKEKNINIPANIAKSFQNQDSGYMEYEGSLNDRVDDITSAFRDWKKTSDCPCMYSSVEAVFPDYILVHQFGTPKTTGRYPSYYDYEDYYGNWDAADLCWKIPYTYDEATDGVTFGEAQQVRLSTVITAIDTNDPEAVQNAMKKDQEESKQDKPIAVVAAKEESEKEETTLVTASKNDEGESSAKDDSEELNQDKNQKELVQTFSVLLQETGFDDKKKVMHVQGTATTADVINSKKQVYPLAVWQENMPKLQEKLQQNRLVGEAEHPEGGRSSIDRTVIKYTKLWQDGNQIKFEADILPTEPHGKNLQVLVSSGVPVDISSRGKGRTKKGEWQGEKDVDIVQSGFECDTFDTVIAGASPGSTISGWEMSQSKNSTDKDEEEMDKEMAEQLLASNKDLNTKFDSLIEALTKKNAGEEEAKNQSAASEASKKEKEDGEKQLEQDKANVAVNSALEDAKKTLEDIKAENAKSKDALLQSRIKTLNTEINDTLPAAGAIAFRNQLTKALEQGKIKTTEELDTFKEATILMVQDVMGSAIAPAGSGHTWVKKTKAEVNANLTPRTVIERLIEGMPDEVPGDVPLFFITQDANGNEVKEGIPDFVKTPKRQMRRILQNMVTERNDHYNGMEAMSHLIMLEQGRYDEVKSLLDQSIPSGATAVGTGGAPTSNVYLFPLIRRVYPQLIMNEIASIQPMDRPEGKFFYLDAYRLETGQNETAPDGTTISDRARIDLSSANAPDPTYSDDPGEFETAKLIQLRLASQSVTAQTKKLSALWSIEETQDLRAYHGLDAAAELMNALSVEIALEWNYVALAEMLAGATGSARTYGVTPPTGYTQFEWEAYLSRYISAVSTDIFKKRNGEMTHIIAGPDAWLAMSSTMRLATAGVGASPEMYAGLVFTPFADGQMAGVRTYKTNLWSGANRNKILIIRRGTTWSDTPYVWAPYATYTSPVLTLPDTFTQKQGIMDRAAHKVVVGDAMGVITISNTTGSAIAFPTS